LSANRLIFKKKVGDNFVVSTIGTNYLIGCGIKIMSYKNLIYYQGCETQINFEQKIVPLGTLKCIIVSIVTRLRIRIRNKSVGWLT